MTFIPVSVPAEIAIEAFPAGAVASWSGRRVAQLRRDGTRIVYADSVRHFEDALFDLLQEAIDADIVAKAKAATRAEEAAAFEAQQLEAVRLAALAAAAFDE